jgi:hypothetical protein
MNRPPANSDAAGALAIISRCAQACRDLGELGADQVADYLDAGPPALLQRLAATANSAGHSVRAEIVLTERNRLLRVVNVPLRQLTTEYDRYRSGAWLRDRALTTGCPYGDGDRRSTYFLALKLIDRPLGIRQLRRIIL